MEKEQEAPTPQEDIPNPPNNWLTRADVTSLIAVVVSLTALFVSIYEANIMKQQQEIMQSQQKASVWPYIKSNLSLVYSDTAKYKLTFTNKGIGPALVKKATLKWNNTPIEQYLDLVDSVTTALETRNFYNLDLGDPSRSVISPGETFPYINLAFPKEGVGISLFRSLPFRYEIIYCSIYDDCWRITESTGTPERYVDPD
jgi:hypothetical protein